MYLPRLLFDVGHRDFTREHGMPGGKCFFILFVFVFILPVLLIVVCLVVEAWVCFFSLIYSEDYFLDSPAVIFYRSRHIFFSAVLKMKTSFVVSRAGILHFFSIQSQEDFASGECLLVFKFSCKLDFIFLFWNKSSMNFSKWLVCFDFSWKIILHVTKRSVIYVYMQICLYTYLYLCVCECMYVYRNIGTLDVLNNWRKSAKSEQLEKIIRKLVPIIILIKTCWMWKPFEIL